MMLGASKRNPAETPKRESATESPIVALMMAWGNRKEVFMTIRNFTPHMINVILPNGETRSFPSEGNARVADTVSFNSECEGITIRGYKPGQIQGLPEPNDQDTILVSMMVIQANERALDVYRRYDLLAPDTSPDQVVRDSGGKIVGVRGFRAF